MEVNIEDVVSTIHVVDGDSLLAPKTLEKILRAVMEAMRLREEHHKRAQAERKVTGGVQAEQEEES
jgi:hypothetical protein